MTDVLDLATAGDAGRALVGGKAHALGVMMEAGYPVPDGIVVTIGCEPDDLELEEATRRLGPGPFAVRSSGVGEDGSETSLAGVYESFLDVEPANVPQAVRKCRQSSDGQPLAVIVQHMITPTAAGVAFSADPVTGNRSTAVISAVPGLADRLVGGKVEGDEWEVAGRRAKPRRRPTNAINARTARRIARVSRDLAEHFGTPQDVEWAWDGERLWVVQSRPITGLSPEVSWEISVPGAYHRSFRFGEWIPEPVTPLFETWLLSTMERTLHQLHREQIGQIAPEPRHVVVNGWYFYSLNFLPVPGASFGRSFPGILRRALTDPKRVAVMLPQTVRYGFRLYEEEWRDELLPRYRAAVEDAEQRVGTADPGELVELIEDLARLAGEYFASITIVAGSGYKVEVQLGLFWRRQLAKKLDTGYGTLLRGLQPLSELRNGHAVETLDWRKPSIPNTPSGPSPDRGALAGERIKLEEAARAALGPRKRARFSALLADAQHLARVREQQVAGLTLPWPVMRRAVLRIGETLATTGAVERPEDVFFLTRSEVDELLGSPQPMMAAVAKRQAEWETSRLQAPPLTVGRMPAMLKFAFWSTGAAMGAKKSDRALLHGVPASAGRARGPIRIVRDSTEFHTLEPGEILVAPLTAPAWMPLFEKAAAVVTDVGSALAHASIAAREYGIPAVVGCGDATSRLINGQQVVVDGTAGTVEPAL